MASTRTNFSGLQTFYFTFMDDRYDRKNKFCNTNVKLQVRDFFI